MAPPPTPASLADLPKPWLLKLAASDSFKGQNATLWSLYRTCSLFRDLVLQQRQATATFEVPIAATDFPRELRRLCTLARSSRNIRLWFQDNRDAPAPWTVTEPHVAHLLLCAMAQLGGQPLTAVKEIGFYGLELTSAMPMWLPVVCPNVTNLDCCGTVTQHLPLPAPPPPPPRSTATRPAPAPAACQHLQQQLAALPSLSCLTVWDTKGLLEELHSMSITRLQLVSVNNDKAASTRAVQRLPVQFPKLVELDAPRALTLCDAGLEALLSMRRLRRVHVDEMRLARSHAHRPCAWEELSISQFPVRVDVDSVARLPLEGIQRFRTHDVWRCVVPSDDSQAVRRLAAAVKRSRGAGLGRLAISGEDPAALLITLGPLLKALPAEQQRTTCIRGLSKATCEVVQELCRQLTPSVRTLRLDRCTLSPLAFPALLPSLPTTVTRVALLHAKPCSLPREFMKVFESHVLGMCRKAVRPITVCVVEKDLPESALERIRVRLAELGDTHVTLVGYE